ncbi:MAG: FG-GAP repeat domain-containing protein [Planctomycetota bacterium]
MKDPPAATHLDRKGPRDVHREPTVKLKVGLREIAILGFALGQGLVAAPLACQSPTLSPPSLLRLDRFDHRWGAQSYGSGPRATTVVARAHINGDGLSDLLVAGVSINLGMNEYAPPRQLISPSLPTCRYSSGGNCYADFDGDGSTDNAVAVMVDASCSEPHGFVFLNDGNGNMTEVPGALSGLTPSPGLFVPGDLDLDGDEDILVGGFSSGNGSLTNSDCILENSGRGTFTVRHGRFPLFPDPAFAVVVADFDGDGDLDFVRFSTAQLGGFPTRVYLNDGRAHFQVVQTMPSLWPFPIVRSGDLTGDGFSDMLVSDAFGMPCRLFVGSPSGQVFDETWRLPYGPGINHGIADIADFDGDGDIDIVAPERGTRPGAYRVVRFWQNDGRGNFADVSNATVPVLGTEMNPPVGNRFYDIWRLAAADHDNDGDTDVMVVPGGSAAGPAVGGFTLWNLTRHLETTGNPRVGQRDYGVVVYADPGHLVLPIASLGRTILDLPSLGTLQVDPAASVAGPPLTTDIARTGFLPMPIPNLPSLAGTRIYWQGIHVDPNSGAVHLTNAVADTIL